MSPFQSRTILINASRHNTPNSICENLDPDPNISDESDVNRESYFSPKTSADVGRMISIKPVPKNAISSIRDNLDPHSSAIKESDLHSEKHSSLKTSTDAGIMSSIVPILWNADSSICDILDPEKSDLKVNLGRRQRAGNDAGRMISTKSVSLNAHASVH
jgi:hypothetical protein